MEVFKETRNLMSDHFGKLGIKYIFKNIFMIFVTFCLLFSFLYWQQLAQIYTYQQLSFNCKTFPLIVKTIIRQKREYTNAEHAKHAS